MSERDANLESLARLGVTPSDEELAAVGVTPEQYRAEYLDETAEAPVVEAPVLDNAPEVTE